MNLLALPPPSNGAPSSSRCAVSERQPIQSIAPLVEPGQLMDDGWLVGYGPPRPAAISKEKLIVFFSIQTICLFFLKNEKRIL